MFECLTPQLVNCFGRIKHVALLEEVCHWGVGLKVSKAHDRTSLTLSLSLSLSLQLADQM